MRTAHRSVRPLQHVHEVRDLVQGEWHRRALDRHGPPLQDGRCTAASITQDPHFLWESIAS
jgi:hypothetical protein